MTTLDILRKARALIQKVWCRGELRRCIAGRECYCAVGAINRAAIDTTDMANRRLAFTLVHDAVGNITLPIWNDAQKSKRPVLAAFDRAIKKLEEQG